MALDLLGISAVANTVDTIIGRFFPDKTKEEQAQLAAALTVISGQMEINKIEAANNSIFVSGWRPFIGWVCGMACAWNWIGLSMAKFVAAYYGKNLAFSGADVTEMLPLLFGMLGLGAMRSYEKVKGVTK